MSFQDSPTSGPTTPFSEYSSGDFDPDYECDAPQFVDLLRPDSSIKNKAAGDDSWFEKQQDTPFAVRKYEMEPLLDPYYEDLDKTPIASKDGDEPQFLDDNTPTPKPKRSTPRSTQSSNDQQENSVDNLAGQLYNLRMKPFTPVRPSKLVLSTTWADLEDSPPPQVKSQPQVPQVHPHAATMPAGGVLKSGFVPTRSTKPLTIPVEFKFSQRRPAATGASNTVARAEPKKPAMQQPQKSSLVKRTGSSVTIPKPFKFHAISNAKNQQQPANSPYVPLAVKVKEFDRTPDRFKPLSSNAGPAVNKVIKAAASTRPISPKFQSRGKRTTELPTEEKIMQEIHAKEQFKARPLDLRVMHSHGDFGVPRIKKAPTTVPHSPKLMTRHRPHLAGARQDEYVVDKQQANVIRAHPYQPSKKPFQPKLEHREIKPADFRLPGELISQKKREKFEEKLRREEEERDDERRRALLGSNNKYHLNHPHHHHARPVVTMKNTQPLVDPKSPALMTKVRGYRYQEEMKRVREEEEKKLEEMAKFKAHPAPDLDLVFIPKPAEKEPTVPEPLILHTEVRSEERRHFDLMLLQQEEEMELLKVEQQRAEEVREREEIKKLRKLGEFKAQPLKKSAIPFEPKKSQKPLTEPMSPFIGEKRRQLLGGHGL